MAQRSVRRYSWVAAAVVLAGAWLVLQAAPVIGESAPAFQEPAKPPEGQDPASPPEPSAEPPAPSSADDVVDSDVPFDLRQQLEIPLQKKVAELRAKTDAEGMHNERGSYMKRFVKVDDDTYHVVLHRNIAGPEELTTERYLLTLERASGGSTWTIADEKLERTVSGLLFRTKPGDETFQEFDSFSIAREGLTISGGHGALVVDSWHGRPSAISLVADNLVYEYEAPKDLNYFEVLRILKRNEKSKLDVVFPPDRLNIFCQADECEKFLAEIKGRRDITADALPGDLANRYKDYMKEIREARHDNPLGGFRTEQFPERRWYSISMKRKSASDHWAWLDYDSMEPEEVTFGVTRIGDWPTYGPLFTYYSEQTRASQADPYELERRPDAFGLTYDLLGVTGDVDMSVEDADTMRCDLKYRLRVKKPIVLLPMAINTVRDVPGSQEDAKRPSMSVHFIEDGAGQELTYIQVGASFGWVVLPKPAQPGDELTVHVKFTNANALYKLNPSYSYVSRSGWLPFVRFGDMIDEFALNIRVPRRYEVLGVGQQMSSRIQGDYRVAQYASDSPVNFPTIIFGDYQSDKSRIAAKKMDGTEIPVVCYADKTSMMLFSQWKKIEDVRSEVGAGIDEIRANALRVYAEQAANALNLYREIYGVDYPYKKLDLVNDPIGPGYYGQAPASIVYLGSGVFRATGAVAHGGGEQISKFKESVVAHEVGHQWWGSLIASGNFRHYWFIESLAEYSSALYVENLYASQKSPEAGRKAYLEKVEEWRRNILEANSMASVVDADTMWSGGVYPGQARTAAIYNQGPYAFHILRETFGDEKFFAFLKNLAQSLKGKEVVTNDLQLVAEQSFGGNMQWFFDQWIRGIGLPEYSFEYTTRMAEDKTYVVEGKVRQRVVVGADKSVIEGKFYRGIITVTVIGVDKQEYPARVRLEGEVTPFAFKVPVKPRDVVLNKNGEMLAHDITVNQAFAR
jgi:hypothetical protein